MNQVTFSRRISTSYVEASADRFGSATVCTRSTAPRVARARLVHRGAEPGELAIIEPPRHPAQRNQPDAEVGQGLARATRRREAARAPVPRPATPSSPSWPRWAWRTTCSSPSAVICRLGCWRTTRTSESTPSAWHRGEAGIAVTENAIGLSTSSVIRHVRGVPDRCPACGSQRLAPQRGYNTNFPDVEWERPVCEKCGWAGASHHHRRRSGRTAASYRGE